MAEEDPAATAGYSDDAEFDAGDADDEDVPDEVEPSRPAVESPRATEVADDVTRGSAPDTSAARPVEYDKLVEEEDETELRITAKVDVDVQPVTAPEPEPELGRVVSSTDSGHNPVLLRAQCTFGLLFSH